MTLYEIKDAYLKVLNNLEVNEDGEILNADEVEAMQGSFDEKCEAVACYIKEQRALQDAVKNEKDALSKRQKALDSKIDWLCGYLQANMQEVGKREFETPKCKITFRKSTSVNIVDEAVIPEEYIKEEITYKIDKTKIKDALKGGIEVEGASLEVKDNIQVK